jgi:hypothetical protein
MKSLAESWNGANTLVGALWAFRSVGGSMLDVQSVAQHSSLPTGLILVKRSRGQNMDDNVNLSVP